MSHELTLSNLRRPCTSRVTSVLEAFLSDDASQHHCYQPMLAALGAPCWEIAAFAQHSVQHDSATVTLLMWRVAPGGVDRVGANWAASCASRVRAWKIFREVRDAIDREYEVLNPRTHSHFVFHRLRKLFDVVGIINENMRNQRNQNLPADAVAVRWEGVGHEFRVRNALMWEIEDFVGAQITVDHMSIVWWHLVAAADYVQAITVGNRIAKIADVVDRADDAEFNADQELERNLRRRGISMTDARGWLYATKLIEV